MYNSQDIAKNIKDIAKKKNKATGKMLEECGMSKNALSSMNHGFMPQLENLAKVADYLGVSVDLLLGRENKNSTSDEVRSAIISKVYSMPDEQCKKLLAFLESLVLE